MGKGIHEPLNIAIDAKGLKEIERETNENAIGPSRDYAKAVIPLLIDEIRRLRGALSIAMDGSR